MKKLLSINSCNFGSTGTIMRQLSDVAEENGFVAYKAVPYSRSNMPKKDEKTIFIGNIIERNLHLFLSKHIGLNGCFSHIGTYFFLKKVKKINPDVIHLHNLHNSYINLSMLFKFIKKHDIKTVWTLHDCWTFTGKCPHFQLSKCNKWESGCNNCPSLSSYPKSTVDKTQKMYNLKKKWFTGVNNMTIVTPSKWLAGLVRKSFLKDYLVKVIYSGIDLSVFKPTESSFRKDNNLEDKFILLGVVSPWNYQNRYEVFLELSKKIDDTKKIVLVGLLKEQKAHLPANIIGIERTSNQEELAKIYSAADVFVNPTREEVLGLVNIEALACGTPVITFNTGGSPECIDETCGIIVPCGNVDKLEEAINYLCDNRQIDSVDCVKRSKNFEKNDKFTEYINEYK